MSSAADKQAQLHLEQCRRALHEDFDQLHDPARIDAVFADSVDRMRGSGRFEDYVPALAEKLTRDRLTAAAQSEGLVAKAVPEVLFVALNDTGRGQMGAAMMRAIASGRVTVHSAGTGGVRVPVDPGVSEVMREIGLDLDESYSKPLTPEVMQAADVVVTMGRSAGVVEIPDGTRHVDWRIGDPVEAPLDEIRRIRDDISERVGALFDELTTSGAA
jgi:protein-tyrosine-phosphatase